MCPIKGFIDEFIRKSLSEFEYDKQKHTYTFVCDYVVRDDKTHNVIIPINFLPKLEEYLATYGYPNAFKRVPLEPIKPRKTTFKIKPGWTPREQQIEPIDYLCNDPRSRKGISLTMGAGKTSLSTFAAAQVGLVTMIIMGSNIAQWVKSITKQTDIDKEFTFLEDKNYSNVYKWVKECNAQAKTKGSRIWILMGSDSFYQLVNDKVYPEIFVCSTTTLREFIECGESYKNLPWTWQGFLKEYGIGTKIVDEAHQNFHAINKLDLLSNIKNNWSLSATFMRSGVSASRIFNTIYPEEMLCGDTKVAQYTNVTVYAYRGWVPSRFVKRKRGYNAIKYEQYLLKRPMWMKDYLENIVLTEVFAHFVKKRNPGEKCLLFFSTKAMIERVRDYLNVELVKYGLIAKEKIGGTPDDVLNDPNYHIYIGTPSGMGTGRDIPNLRTAINFVSFDSKVLTKQCYGRLRRIPGVDTEWVDNVDRMIDSQVRHWQTRDKFYRKAAKVYHKLKLS
jgi:superfamily II DNA or RNA helicase